MNEYRDTLSYSSVLNSCMKVVWILYIHSEPCLSTAWLNMCCSVHVLCVSLLTGSETSGTVASWPYYWRNAMSQVAH